MGRPKLTPGQRRRHQVTFSLRDGELAELKRRAGVAGLSLPDYLRQRVLLRLHHLLHRLLPEKID